MSDTRANIEITATDGRLMAGLRAAASKVQSWGRGIRAAMKDIKGPAIGTAIGNMATGVGSRAIDFVVDQAKGVMDFEEKLTRLQITANLSASAMNRFRTTARRVSDEVGIGALDILAGAQTYVDLTGDVQGAERAMSTFARIAQASGSSVSDISTAAAAMQQSFKIKPEEIEATFSGLIMQGKAGAVSLKDFAGSLASLAPKWARFNEGSTTQGVAQMGAAFQVVRQGAGSAEEAATNMESLMGALIQHAKTLKSVGHVDVFDTHKDGTRTLKSFEQIMDAIDKSKQMKDPELLMKALGSRKEAGDALNMIMRARHEVTATGDAYHDMVAQGLDAGAVQRDLGTYMSSTSGKIATAMETVKNKMAEVLTPERIKAFADALVQVADVIVHIVEGLDAMVSKTDIAGNMAKAMGDALIGVNQNLTAEQKRRKADEYMRKAQAIEGDDFQSEGRRQGYVRAAKELKKEGADAWAVEGGGASVDASKVKATIGRVMAEADPIGRVVMQSIRDINTAAGKGSRPASQSEQILAAVLAELKRINENTSKNQIRIGDNQVAKAVASAPNARAGKK